MKKKLETMVEIDLPKQCCKVEHDEQYWCANWEHICYYERDVCMFMDVNRKYKVTNMYHYIGCGKEK